MLSAWITNLRVCIKATQCKPKEIIQVRITGILVLQIENDKNDVSKLRKLCKLGDLF